MCFVCQRPDRKIIQRSEAIIGVLAGEEGDKYVSRGENGSSWICCFNVIQSFSKSVLNLGLHAFIKCLLCGMELGYILRVQRYSMQDTSFILGAMNKTNREDRNRRGDLRAMAWARQGLMYYRGRGLGRLGLSKEASVGGDWRGELVGEENLK